MNTAGPSFSSDTATSSCSVTFTVPSGYPYMRALIASDSTISPSDFQSCLYSGPTSTTAVCPVTGKTAVNVYQRPTSAPSDGATHTLALGRTVYRGSVDLVSGVLTVNRISISPTAVTDSFVSASSGLCVGVLASNAVPASDNDTAGTVLCDRAETLSANAQLSYRPGADYRQRRHHGGGPQLLALVQYAPGGVRAGGTPDRPTGRKILPRRPARGQLRLRRYRGRVGDVPHGVRRPHR